MRLEEKSSALAWGARCGWGWGWGGEGGGGLGGRELRVRRERGDRDVSCRWAVIPYFYRREIARAQINRAIAQEARLADVDLIDIVFIVIDQTSMFKDQKETALPLGWSWWRW